MNNWQINQRIDLAQGPASVAVWPKALMVVGDGSAHEWRVEVMDDGKPAEISGKVMGYFIRVDGATVAIEGKLEGNVASVVLDDTCYAYEGDLKGILRVTDSNSTVTLSALLFRVTYGTTDQIVDPGTIVPSLESLLQQIENMRTAAENANTAADNANTEANSANAAAQSANNAAAAANTATSNADAATAKANTAAENADTATERANAAASGVEAATQRANDAADRVDDSIQAATEAADAANNAADAANTATAGAESATESANAAAYAANSATGDASRAAQEASSAANAANEAADRANQAAAGLGITKKIVDALPPVDEMAEDVIYLVPSQVPGESNVYEEYMKIEGKAEMIGSTATDLTDYVKFEDIPDHLITGEAEGGIQTLYNQTTSEPIFPRTVVEALSGTGTEGQLVGYTEDNVVGNITPDATPTPGSTNPVQSNGVYESTKWHTNPNLLDNWYFAGGGSQLGGGQFPINQRGQTEYIGAGYAIDRFRLIDPNSKLAIQDDKITLSVPDDNEYGITILSQIIPEEMLKFLYRKTITLSVLTDNGLYSVSMDVPEDAVTYDSFTSGFHINIGGWIVDVFWYELLGGFRIWVNPHTISTLNLVAVKLELGSVQTLAHKDGDTWILNEMPDYATELAKCQRYYLPINRETDFSGLCWGLGSHFFIPTPIQMRANPTIELSNRGMIYGTNGGIGINIDPFSCSTKSNGVFISFGTIDDIPGGCCTWTEAVGALSADL